MLFYWKLTVLFHLTLIVRPVVFIYLLASNQFFHPTVLYCILAVTCMLICTSFSRIYEVEFFFRVSYQVRVFLNLERLLFLLYILQVMSWHSFRAFFVQSTRGLAHNDLRYPITSLLKLRSSIFLKLSDGLASKKVYQNHCISSSRTVLSQICRI